ncbi:thiolase family protein [Cryobacterium fucosi]|uniref:Thiolase family protein n=1 Tax=Cryobacterium fucosi TaxID=1259157 RepID=A0A4R9B5C0_9MICO|nr:thiolase family protein [Cryobacterium fucosi]
MGSDTDREPVIVLGRRTAFGRVNGGLAQLTADRLLAPVLAALLADSGVAPDTVDDVIVGNAVGGGGNVARLSLLRAGLPVSVPGLTVDRQCGSGLEAIVLACRLVAAGAGDVYLAGGVESCSTAPLRAHRLSSTPGRPDFFDRVRFSPDEVGDPEMGVAAENVADRFGITRERQDAFALRSHRLAIAASESGQLTEEIVTLDTDTGRVDADEGPRRSLTAGLLPRFAPAFRAGGTVTAGNSCADADGAVAVLVTSRRTADALGLGGGLRFVDSAVTGTNPVLLGIAEERANPQGGALAVGHPFGASGALLVLNLLRQCRAAASAGDLGLTAVSIAGGLGVAALWRWDGTVGGSRRGR